MCTSNGSSSRAEQWYLCEPDYHKHEAWLDWDCVIMSSVSPPLEAINGGGVFRVQYSMILFNMRTLASRPRPLPSHVVVDYDALSASWRPETYTMPFCLGDWWLVASGDLFRTLNAPGSIPHYPLFINSIAVLWVHQLLVTATCAYAYW